MKKIFLFSILLLGACSQNHNPSVYFDGENYTLLQSSVINNEDYPYKFNYPDSGQAYVTPQTVPGFLQEMPKPVEVSIQGTAELIQ